MLVLGSAGLLDHHTAGGARASSYRLVRFLAGGRVPMTRMGRWQQGHLTMWGGGLTTGRLMEG